MDNRKSRHFFGNEKDTLTLTGSGCNNVGDRLRLARTGGALNHKVSSRTHLFDDFGLGSVSVNDMK